MKKVFYLINLSVVQNQEWIKLVNPPYLEKNLGFAIENEFWFDLKRKNNQYQDLGQRFYLCSVSEIKKSDFVESCKEVGIEIEEVNLEKYYDDYVEENRVYSPSKQDDIPSENMIIICNRDVNKIICASGTKQVFLEHKIANKDNIQIYINSNEIAGHSVPHCHVKYNEISNYCVLSLVDFKKLAPDKNKTNAVVCRAQELLKGHIQEARKKWNEIDSPLKFKISNGEYSSEFYKTNRV